MLLMKTYSLIFAGLYEEKDLKNDEDIYWNYESCCEKAIWYSARLVPSKLI